MRVELEKYKQAIYEQIENFPGIMLDNDYKTKWVYGGIYTFEPLRGYVLNYGAAVVLYQELEVIQLDEDGNRTVIGKTIYTNIVDNGAFLALLGEYEQSTEYRQEELTDVLFYAVDEKIKDFGNGFTFKGCEFVTNEEDVLLTEIDVLKEVVKRFRKRMDDFFVDILVQEEFNKGIYRIDIDGVEVGYEDVNGWGVLLMLNIQHYKTLSRRKVEIIYHTNVLEVNKAPDLETVRVYIMKEVRRFIKNNQVRTHFGVEFRFSDLREGKKEVDVYKKIRGKKEDVDVWANRFATVLGNHQEMLRTKIKGIKTVDDFGMYMTLHSGHVVVFSEGGIMLSDGREVYIKKEMNLQDGLRNLSKVLGRNKFTLDTMKTYDYRTRIKEKEEDNNG